MKGHSHWLSRSWTLPLAAVVVVVGHVIFFNQLRHAGLPLAVISGLALLAIAIHLGLPGPMYALLRRRHRS